MRPRGKEKFAIKRKRRVLFAVALCVVLFGFGVYVFLGKNPSRWEQENTKTIEVVDGHLRFSFGDVSEKTVGDFLVAQKLDLKEGDSVFPVSETQIFSGTRIIIARAHEVKVKVDGSEKVLRTQAMSVEQALVEGSIVLDEDDIVKPVREAGVVSGMVVTITRVLVSEETTEVAIAFDKKVNEDDELSWRKTIVTQKGEKGVKQLTYRVSQYDGKEVNRRLIETKITKDPITEVTTQGTYVKTGKAHRGGASWYAWTGTMAAANPWLPKGSYVKVTNMENGKSVIVVINDRGPFVPGRIIDLDKVAFQKIASIGAGVINVKMEEITN